MPVHVNLPFHCQALDGWTYRHPYAKSPNQYNPSHCVHNNYMDGLFMFDVDCLHVNAPLCIFIQSYSSTQTVLLYAPNYQ